MIYTFCGYPLPDIQTETGDENLSLAEATVQTLNTITLQYGLKSTDVLNFV